MKRDGTSKRNVLLFVAGGAGAASNDDFFFGKASLNQTASGNKKNGSSGNQKFIFRDEKDIFSGGAGVFKGPVSRGLRVGSVAPKSYKDGLIGGKGIDLNEELTEGGFGGGGAHYYKNGHNYCGAGGGYTGGGTKLSGYDSCNGGGGGSFSIDEEAKFDHVHENYAKCTVTYLD